VGCRWDVMKKTELLISLCFYAYFSSPFLNVAPTQIAHIVSDKLSKDFLSGNLSIPVCFYKYLSYYRITKTYSQFLLVNILLTMLVPIQFAYKNQELAVLKSHNYQRD
jgi:hypothetical protein